MIGFGISDRKTFDKACSYANGAIIGTAFVKAIENGNIEESVSGFMKEFK
ncbi:tryptophan synthase subunit alpha [Pedobacter fastidiosus]